MGKKSRSSGSTNDGTPDDAQSPARNHHSDANKSAPLPTEESTPAQEGPGWIRFKVRDSQGNTAAGYRVQSTAVLDQNKACVRAC